MMRAQLEVNEQRLIAWQRDPVERLRPAHALELHRQSVEAVEALLAEPFDRPTIVVTRHAPSPRSIASRYQGDGLNPGSARISRR